MVKHKADAVHLDKINYLSLQTMKNTTTINLAFRSNLGSTPQTN